MTALGGEELASLLERTSRTFALAIPLLGEPLATQVGVAYLLFRIADTFEDAPLWGREARTEALSAFGAWMTGDGALPSAARHPTGDAGCLELLARADAVRESLRAFPDGARAAITRHVLRTADGMRAFVERQGEGGSIALRDIDDLRAYCYVVAGIVGEMLTELFVRELEGLDQTALSARARSFGEGLQLVNILKDAPADAREGRAYLPAGVPRGEVSAMARADLARAEEYVALLPPGGARAFCELPVRLAVATLDALERGAAKLSREEAARIFGGITGALPR
jgi:farnesyl-diphosphate farnesyltransferase